MAVQLASLIPTQYVPNTAQALYTSPQGITTRIDSLAICNATGPAAQVTIYLVSSGGSPGPANITTGTQTVLPGQTWNSANEIGKVLRPGDAIAVMASGSNVLTINAAGLQATAP
jgi:hypothetical protein